MFKCNYCAYLYLLSVLLYAIIILVIGTVAVCSNTLVKGVLHMADTVLLILLLVALAEVIKYIKKITALYSTYKTVKK